MVGKTTLYRFLSPLRLPGLSAEVAEKGKEDEGQTADFDGPLPLIREKFEMREIEAADEDVEDEPDGDHREALEEAQDTLSKEEGEGASSEKKEEHEAEPDEVLILIERVLLGEIPAREPHPGLEIELLVEGEEEEEEGEPAPGEFVLGRVGPSPDVQAENGRQEVGGRGRPADQGGVVEPRPSMAD
jgi:hypothetical protein